MTADFSSYRNYLYRYALLQLRDPNLADDVTQETLLAAFEQANRFSGKSSERTWLTGILKHKILDVLRARKREPGLKADLADESFDHLTTTLFDERGHWAAPSAVAWGKPDKAMEKSQFWQVLEWCLDNLSANAAQVFFLREIHGLEIIEICKELEITATNCSVLLYRARLGLRTCLAEKGFADSVVHTQGVAP